MQQASTLQKAKKKPGRASRQNQNQASEKRPIFDMDQAQPKQKEENDFSDWDIRKEENVRPKIDDTQYEEIEKKDFDTFRRETSKSDDDELDTPPFFRRKR